MVVKLIDNILEMVKRPIYLGTILILQLVYLLIFLKVIDYTPKLILYLDYFIQAFVSIFLIIKFHPFRKHEIKEFDSTIIFGSAFFLLANIGLSEFIKNYFEKTVKNADGEVKK
jgi:hypothetical protein